MPIYTFENREIQDNNIILGDESYKVILNTAYSNQYNKDINQNLIKFLNYIRTGEIHDNSCYLVECVQKELDSLKKDNMVRRDFMNSLEHDKLIKEQGIQQGIQQVTKEIAISSINNGLTNEVIHLITKLSIGTIENLRKELQKQSK